MDERLYSTIVFSLALLIGFSALKPASGNPISDDVQNDEDQPKKDNGKIVIPYHTSVSVEEGESVSIPCGIEGTNFAIVWYKNGTDSPIYVDGDLLQSSMSQHYGITKDNYLIIHRVSSQTAGNYTCFTSPGVKTVHTVGIKVSIEIGHIQKTLEVGANLLLPCKVGGYPEPVVEWYKQKSPNSHDSELIGRSANITISHVNVSDSGTYTCSAYNSENKTRVSKSVTINVVNGLAAEYDTVYAVPNGNHATLCCIFKKHSKEHPFYWLKDGKEVDYSDRVKSAIHNKSKFCLIINELRETDLGNYTCRTTKADGSVEKASINFSGAPAIPQLELVNIDTSDKVPVPLLKWRVSTYSPLQHYTIFVQKQEENDWSSYYDAPIISTDKEEIIEQKFDRLSSGLYNVKLVVRNKHGVSQFVSNDNPLSIDKFGSDGNTDGNSAAFRSSGFVSVSFLVTIFTILLC